MALVELPRALKQASGQPEDVAPWHAIDGQAWSAPSRDRPQRSRMPRSPLSCWSPSTWSPASAKFELRHGCWLAKSSQWTFWNPGSISRLDNDFGRPDSLQTSTDSALRWIRRQLPGSGGPPTWRCRRSSRNADRRAWHRARSVLGAGRRRRGGSGGGRHASPGSRCDRDRALAPLS